MQLITTVTPKGQVVIPKALRDQFLLKPFDRVAFRVVDDGIVVKPLPTASQMMGFVKTKKRFTEVDFRRAIEEGFIEDYLGKNDHR